MHLGHSASIGYPFGLQQWPLVGNIRFQFDVNGNSCHRPRGDRVRRPQQHTTFASFLDVLERGDLQLEEIAGYVRQGDDAFGCRPCAWRLRRSAHPVTQAVGKDLRGRLLRVVRAHGQGKRNSDLQPVEARANGLLLLGRGADISLRVEKFHTNVCGRWMLTKTFHGQRDRRVVAKKTHGGRRLAHAQRGDRLTGRCRDAGHRWRQTKRKEE